MPTLPITPMIMRGLGSGPSMVALGIGPIIGKVIQVLRGGRSSIKDLYKNKIEEFIIAARLIEINGKDLVRPIFNKDSYRIDESIDTQVSVYTKSINRKEKSTFSIFAKAIKIKRGSDGNN